MNRIRLRSIFLMTAIILAALSSGPIMAHDSQDILSKGAISNRLDADTTPGIGV